MKPLNNPPTGRRYPRVLIIAGSEPLGSSGIQADIKSISACGAYAAGSVTCIVDDDTLHVKSVYPLPVELVAGQISSFLGDVGADAVKIGLLTTVPIIETVAETLKSFGAKNIVLDPVMVTSGGDQFIGDEVIAALRKHLFPLARVITPNLREARLLLDSPKEAVDWAKSSRKLTEAGCSVIVKSIPAKDDCLEDLLCDAATGQLTAFTKKRIDTRNVNGTGCSFSSAIAAYLAQGFELSESVRRAEEFIQSAIVSGADYRFGAGYGPIDHSYRLREKQPAEEIFHPQKAQK